MTTALSAAKEDPTFTTPKSSKSPREVTLTEGEVEAFRPGNHQGQL
jgi:hypothetical protein